LKNKTSDTDQTLIQKIKEGDTSAFGQLIEKYKNVSLSLVYSILKDKELSEDVLQDIFIKVFEKIDSFKYQSIFSTWLYRIVINTSYNELKKIKPKVDIDNITLLPEGFITKEDFFKVENQKRFIQLALKAIKPEESVVLNLFYLCEMSILEITKITGFSESKIKVNLHRGRSNLDFQLRRLLGDELKNLL
jgi:RNA polymerase sigma factor (sigma-70 family)